MRAWAFSCCPCEVLLFACVKQFQAVFACLKKGGDFGNDFKQASHSNCRRQSGEPPDSLQNPFRRIRHCAGCKWARGLAYSKPEARDNFRNPAGFGNAGHERLHLSGHSAGRQKTGGRSSRCRNPTRRPQI